MSYNPMSPLEEAIRLSVDHITNRAQHYFSVVRSKSEDGVLWFAFTYKDDAIATVLRNKKFLSADDAVRNGYLTVKKTAFLPISAIVTTDSKPLLDMTSRCDKRQQFVAWFTLEAVRESTSMSGSSTTTSGTPQVSKVIIVDTLNQQAPQPSIVHQQQHLPRQTQQDMPSRYATPGRAGILKSQQQQQQDYSITQNNISEIDALKRDMQSTASHLRNQQREFAAGSGRTLGGATSNASSSLQQQQPPQRYNSGSSVSPTRGGPNALSRGHVSFQHQPNHQHYDPHEGSHQQQTASTTTLTPVNDANYSHLLKVSLQISDSVAKLSNKLDDLASQYFAFEKSTSAAIMELKNKLNRLDNNVLEIRPKLTEVSDSTMHFGTKIAHLRQETQAMFEGVSRRVQSLSDSVIASNLRMTTTSSQNNNNNNTSSTFAPSPSVAVQQQQQQTRSERTGSQFNRNDNNNNNNNRSASAALAAVEEADRIVNFDDLVAKHSFSVAPKHHRKESSSDQQQRDRVSPAQNALNSFLDENYDRKANFASRKADLDHREYQMSHAQEAVDEYNTVARDVINYEVERQDEHHPISLTGVHRQKASLELARQHAADKSEAQAIASSYMVERNRAIQNSSFGDAHSPNSGGVAVPLERAHYDDEEEGYTRNSSRATNGNVGGGSFVVSDDAQLFSGSTEHRRTESLADMIASMERRLG